MSTKFQKRIKIRMFLVQILAIIPLLLFIFYLFDLWYDTRRVFVLEQNINYARLVSKSLNEILSKGKLSTEIFVDDPTFLNAFQKDQKSAIQTIQKVTAKLSPLFEVHILDMNGNILTSNEKKRADIINHENSIIRKAIQQKETIMSLPDRIKSGDAPIVLIASPIIQQENILAVITTIIDVEKLKESIENTIPKNNQIFDKKIIVLDNSGKIVLTTFQSFPTNEERSVLAKNGNVIEAQKGNLHFFENQSFPPTNEKVIGASVAVSDYDWVILSMSPTKEIFAPIFKIQSYIWLILISAIAFAIGIISYQLRRLQIVY